MRKRGASSLSVLPHSLGSDFFSFSTEIGVEVSFVSDQWRFFGLCVRGLLLAVFVGVSAVRHCGSLFGFRPSKFLLFVLVESRASLLTKRLVIDRIGECDLQ